MRQGTEVNSMFVSPPYHACSSPRRYYNLSPTYRSRQSCLQVHVTNRSSDSTSREEHEKDLILLTVT